MRPFLVHETTEQVANCLRQLYAHDPSHARLVDDQRGRSKADPWVIAHAMAQDAIVVTKEKKITNPLSTVVKIPNVCENLNVPCIDDFQFIRELQMKFDCKC